MLKVFRHLLFVLLAFAIVGGTTTQLAQSAQYAAPMTMAGMPCDMMMPAAAATDNGKPTPPCDGMTPDCIKLMGCVTAVALPTRFVSHEVAVHVTTVDYWSTLSKLAVLVRTPEPFPPRTI
jgi:hypothetical protein